MNDERLAELQEKYKNRKLLQELVWGAYADHSGYTTKQNGEFLNWLCMTAYKALKERPKGKWIPVSERPPEEDGRYYVTRHDYVTQTDFTDILWYEKGLWWNRQSTGDYAVIAWMPKPELYKAES